MSKGKGKGKGEGKGKGKGKPKQISPGRTGFDDFLDEQVVKPARKKMYDQARVQISRTDRRRRGRPVGWRKPDAMRTSIMVRLPADAAAWLGRTAKKMKMSRGRIIRGLINAFLVREATARELARAGRR